MPPWRLPKPPIPDLFNHFEFPDLRPARDWAELPLDAISYILRKLDQVELLMGGLAAVCSSWRRVARDEPELWRRIAIPALFPDDFDDLARAAVRLSAGQCEEFSCEYLDLDDDFLLFLAHRAPLLITLRLKFCKGITNERFAAAITNFPLLEELELKLQHGVDYTGVFEHVARSCPRMKHITYLKYGYYFNYSYITDPGYDGNALAIANMPELRTLHLLRDKLTNTGLASIIDNCPHLEYIYLRGCRNITMDDDLRAKCARIKKITLLPDCNDYRGDFKTGSTFNPCWLRNLWYPTIAHDAVDGSGDSISHESLDSYGYYLGEDDETSLKEYDRILEKSMRRYKI